MLLIVVISMSVASDYSSFVCGSSSSAITICRRINSNALTTMQTTSGGVLSLSLRSDSRLLAMGGKDGKYMSEVWSTVESVSMSINLQNHSLF